MRACAGAVSGACDDDARTKACGVLRVSGSVRVRVSEKEYPKFSDVACAS